MFDVLMIEKFRSDVGLGNFVTEYWSSLTKERIEIVSLNVINERARIIKFVERVPWLEIEPATSVPAPYR